MTARSRPSLKNVFADGDTPAGSDFADGFDSFISVIDTTAQSMQSQLIVPALQASIVSADTVTLHTLTVSDFFTAVSAEIDVLHILAASVDSLEAVLLSAANGNFVQMSAHSLDLNGTLNFTATFETTVRAAAGTANIVPTTAHGFLVATVNGTSIRIPYFKSS